MAANFVVLCIIIVFAAFAVACFLMGTVNPPPLGDNGIYSTNITARRPVKGCPLVGGRRSGSGNHSGCDQGVVAVNSSGSEVIESICLDFKLREI